MGHEVAGVGSDGKEGIELYKSTKPDIVLLDVTMPNMDGRQCLREILQIDASAHVMMVSAVSTAEVKEQCLSAGAKDFVDKVNICKTEIVEAAIKNVAASIEQKKSA